MIISEFISVIIPDPVAIERRIHLFSYRTQKLSFLSSKILGWRRPGKIEHCWITIKATARGCFFVFVSCSIFPGEDNTEQVGSCGVAKLLIKFLMNTAGLPSKQPHEVAFLFFCFVFHLL